MRKQREVHHVIDRRFELSGIDRPDGWLARRRVYFVPRILFESCSIPAMDHQDQIFSGSIGKNRSPQTEATVEHRNNGKGKMNSEWRCVK
jgi:hypothetical protein